MFRQRNAEMPKEAEQSQEGILDGVGKGTVTGFIDAFGQLRASRTVLVN